MLTVIDYTYNYLFEFQEHDPQSIFMHVWHNFKLILMKQIRFIYI